MYGDRERLLIAAAALLIILALRKKRMRRCRRRKKIRRSYIGTNLLADVRRDPSGKPEIFGSMSAEDFEYIHNIIGPLIKRNNVGMMAAIPTQERLGIALRFLATGESFQSIANLFRVTELAVSRSVMIVCDAVISALKNEIKVYSDSFLPDRIDLSQAREFEEARLAISHTLQSCLQSDGRRRYATPPQQIAAFNRRVQPEIIGDSGGDWIKPEGDTVIGNDIFRLSPQEQFNIHFPYKRGDFNIHPGPGGSITSVMADLETIWTYIIETNLQINSSEFKNFKAVLVVPDVYNRTYLRELMYLLLGSMGFGSCFLVQDHVSATFGSGLSYACVVDVGDQKTSVSCVEDGICHPNTRVRLEYGGGDITQIFYWLLQKCAFPYKECDDQNKLDSMLLRKLKEELCHVNLDVCGSQEKSFTLKQPEKPIYHFTIQVGDECIIAPLSLFNPELFGITGPKQIHTQKISTGDPEDPHDEIYLRDIRKKGMKEESTSNELNESYLESQQGGNDDDIVVDAMDPVITQSVKEFVTNPGQILGLDQAVLQSIDRCPNEDLKRKMYGCVLVVGGGMKFSGIGTWLQNRISLQIPYLYRAEQLDIITNPRDMDSSMVAWKGACIMSCLETAQELWIEATEWQKYGVRVLRERAPFTW